MNVWQTLADVLAPLDREPTPEEWMARAHEAASRLLIDQIPEPPQEKAPPIRGARVSCPDCMVSGLVPVGEPQVCWFCEREVSA